MKRNVRPAYSANGRAAPSSICEKGTNPRWPPSSTVKPPLFSPATFPSTGTPLRRASCRRSRSSARAASACDSSIAPPVARVTRNWARVPTRSATSSSGVIPSSGITASLRWPTSMSRAEAVRCTTVPSTRSPAATAAKRSRPVSASRRANSSLSPAAGGGAAPPRDKAGLFFVMARV